MRRLILIATAAIGLTAGAANASCLPQSEEDKWHNVDNNTRSITRANLRYVCQEDPLTRLPIAPGPTWYIKLWGSCTPSDCAWDEVKAKRLDNGWIKGHINQGFAKREIFARMNGNRLRIYIRTDFTDPNREDYTSNNFFNRN